MRSRGVGLGSGCVCRLSSPVSFPYSFYMFPKDMHNYRVCIELLERIAGEKPGCSSFYIGSEKTRLPSPLVLQSEQLKQCGCLGKEFCSHYPFPFIFPSEHLQLEKRPGHLGFGTHSFFLLFPSPFLPSLPCCALYTLSGL